MCDGLRIGDQDTLGAAREAADVLLGRYLGLPVEKAYRLDTPAGFDLAVAQLGLQLRSRAAEPELEAVRAAVQEMDVDWLGSTPAQRRGLVSAAVAAAGRHTRPILTGLRTVLLTTTEQILDGTRRHARRQGLAISPTLNAVDQRIRRHLVASESVFLRDEYGYRQRAFERRALEIVADGLESGLGRYDIAAALGNAAQGLLQRGPFYWETVAGSLIGRGRSYGQISAFAEAGVQRYTIHAVLDEATTDICRFLHGKTFTVGDAMARIVEAERIEDAAALKEHHPWLRRGVGTTGEAYLYVQRNGRRLQVAAVERSAAGIRDEVGIVRSTRTEGELMQLGLGFPPYHGLCRSVVSAA